MEKFFEKWQSPINEVVLGGGKNTARIGGAQSLPFVKGEGNPGNPPIFALEISDIPPVFRPEPLKDVWGDVWDDPSRWAKKAVSVYGSDAICLRLKSAHPDFLDRSPEDCARIVSRVAEVVPDTPLIVIGCELPSKDIQVIPAVSRALKGKNALLGIVTKDNYKPITSAALADGHNIISEAPVDINLAKQLHILLSSECGFPVEKIVLHQTTGALGYGYEYCYTIMEKTRLAGLQGDSMLAVPMINFVGAECWKLKESVTPDATNSGGGGDVAPPEWGSYKTRGIIWETVCGAAYLQGGADVVVMYHPEALKAVRKISQRLLAKE